MPEAERGELPGRKAIDVSRSLSVLEYAEAVGSKRLRVI